MKNTITNTNDANMNNTTELTLDERNAMHEKEAQKALKKSLFALYNTDKVSFVRALQFNDRDAVKRFTTTYIMEAEDGTTVEAPTGVRFTIFDLWNDENDPKRAQRTAINAFIKAVADEASEHPTKGVKGKAVEHLRGALRLLGFAEYADKINTSGAKKILCSAYRLTDNAKDDARDKEVKRALQAILWQIVTTAKGGNARKEREARKALEKIGNDEKGNTKAKKTTVEAEHVDGVKIA